MEGGGFYVLLTQQPRRPTLFPYTTLFRSHRHLENQSDSKRHVHEQIEILVNRHDGCDVNVSSDTEQKLQSEAKRSEEHTSELQSPVHLVCRPLPEKHNPRLTRAHSLA